LFSPAKFLSGTMANRFILFFVTVFIALLGLAGCAKQEKYPDIPEIAFEGFTTVFDTGQYAVEGILVISFRDGNGDIGLYANDTFPPYNRNGNYYYNYIINYFEKQNGVFREIVLDPPFNARIPYLTPANPNKAIKGIIADTLGLNPHPSFDTIKFEAYIYDRALNKSNVISTPEIILRKR
jgi:hypothetical protein